MSDPTVQQWLVVAAAFLSGLLVKWLLDLFFLRQRFFETRAQLNAREQQLTEARHEHSRTSESLKNRLIELDATTKAKLAAEGLAARRGREIEALQAEITSCRSRNDLLENRAVALEQLGSELRLQRDSAEVSAAETRSELLGLRLDKAVQDARITSQDGALAELRAIRESLIQERDDIFARCLVAESDRAAQQSVNQALVQAVASRDTSLDGLGSRIAELEAELRSVSDLLASHDAEVARLQALASQADLQRQQRAEAEAEAGRLRTQLDSITRLRDEAVSALRRREAEAVEAERKAAEYQSAFDDAARENARIGQELSRNQAAANASSTALKNAESALKQAESARGAAEARVAELAQALQSAEERLRNAAAAAASAPPLPPPAPVANPAPAGPPVPDPAVKRRIESAEKAASMAETARLTMEAELAAVSESHARLESQLAELRPQAARAEDLAEKLGAVESELAQLRGTGSGPKGDLDSLLNDLDQVTRERNELAAELALLRSQGRSES